jgi:hypothetical protein
MTNPRIEKVKTEIEKTKARIAELTAKLREQEREKVRLENEQIVALVRSERISDAELSALMNSLRREEPAAPANVKTETIKEETRNAYQDEN